jgi:hypothetical protein
MAQQQVQPSQISANNTTSGQVLVSNGTVASWGAGGSTVSTTDSYVTTLFLGGM